MSASEAAPNTRFSIGLSSIVTFATDTFLAVTFLLTGFSASRLLVFFAAISSSTSSRENTIGVDFLLAAAPSRETTAFYRVSESSP